jgi:hypothetical protein
MVTLPPPAAATGLQTGQPSTAAQHAEPVVSRMARIARRAHELYEARGGEGDGAINDWLQAEREIDGVG